MGMSETTTKSMKAEDLHKKLEEAEKVLREMTIYSPSDIQTLVDALLALKGLKHVISEFNV